MEEFRRLSAGEMGRPEAGSYREMEKFPFVFVLDSIRSLNNVGSVFRTADGFNASAVWLCGHTGVPPHREIQKTALGATETVPWRYFPSVAGALEELRSQGFAIWALEQTTGSRPLHSVRFAEGEKAAFVLGNEIHGVSDEALALCRGVLEIPQFGTKHSLNVSVTAGIVAWHYLLGRLSS